eukprot:549310-Pyramimonas_sp.AAC.1
MELTLHPRSSIRTALERFLMNKSRRQIKQALSVNSASLPLEAVPREDGPEQIPAGDPGAELDSDDE